MRTLKILHTGDIHPNNAATFAGRMAIDRSTGQNLALTDLEQSLNHITTEAFRRQLHLALIAGDLFDTHKPHPNEIRIIRAFVSRLATMMKVVAIPGNHDMSQNPNDNTALEAIKGIPDVHVVERPSILELELHHHNVRIACLPYPTKGRLLTQDRMMDKSPEEVTATINEGLRAIMRELAPPAGGNVVNILLAHGSVANAQVSEQPRSIEYDILIPREEFDRFHYVALGHIHRPQQVELGAYYCGSLLRQSFGEEEEPKGVATAELEEFTSAYGREYRIRSVGRIENPHARTYATLTREDWRRNAINEDGPKLLDPACVWRFKDTLTAEQEDEIRPALDRLAKSTPWFQIAIERVEEARTRDAGMTGMLSGEDALARVLLNIPTANGLEVSLLYAKHREIEQALT